MKTAVVVGSAGQDGQLLTQALEKEGWRVIGVSRRGPVDLLDAKAVARLIKREKPAEVYYVAAFHHSTQDLPKTDAELYGRSHDVHVRGLHHFLEAIAAHAPKTRLFYAASSLVFGRPSTWTQDERTPLAPIDAYGLTKAAGVLACRLYRARGVYASVGFLYNHESSLRAPRFLSRKLSLGVADIKAGRAKTLTLGDLDAKADWGWAPETVDAMRRILALAKSDDFVIATGKAASVRDFAAAAFAATGLDWKKHVRVDKTLIARRKPLLVGDARKLRRATGWRPTVGLAEIARRMVVAELSGIS